MWLIGLKFSVYKLQKILAYLGQLYKSVHIIFKESLSAGAGLRIYILIQNPGSNTVKYRIFRISLALSIYQPA